MNTTSLRTNKRRLVLRLHHTSTEESTPHNPGPSLDPQANSNGHTLSTQPCMSCGQGLAIYTRSPPHLLFHIAFSHYLTLSNTRFASTAYFHCSFFTPWRFTVRRSIHTYIHLPFLTKTYHCCTPNNCLTIRFGKRIHTLLL